MQPFPQAPLTLDCAAEVERISRFLKQSLRQLKRRGLVVAISGGIDSSVCAALAVRAIGAERIHALLLPERDSSGAATRLGRQVVDALGIDHTLVDIGETLTALGCYQARDDAIRQLVPEYTANWKNKIVLKGGLDGAMSHFELVVEDPAGQSSRHDLPLQPYLQIVAATNYKQRVRKTVEYFHADRLNYAVVGTPNRLEYDQGFFVKNGDGSADIKPIAHLYKTQVYALGEFLQLPEEIRAARPTTDTYSLAQSQEEFFFSLPYEKMDLALFGYEHGVAAEALAERLDIQPVQALAIYRDIEQKRRTAGYLHQPALTLL